VRKDGQDHGPFSADELASMIARDQLAEEHVLRGERGGRELCASDHPGLRGDFEAKRRARAAEQERRQAARAARGAWLTDLARRGATIGAGAALLALVAHRTLTHGAGLDPVAITVLVVGALATAWGVRRVDPRPADEPWATAPSWLVVGLGAVAALAASAPLARLAPWIGGRAPAGFGDELGLARAAADLARDGLRHGWVDGFLGGFPLAGHEASLGVLVVRALVGAGLSPLGATHALGTLALGLAPLALFAAILRCGGRVAPAVAAALVLAWASPDTPFAGGWEAFFTAGLLTRSLALPVCILTAAELARAETRWSAPALATVGILLNPPLTLVTLFAGTLGSVAGGRRESLEACGRALLAAGAVGAAFYGPALGASSVPFGPPPELAWRTEGLAASRLLGWVRDGSLLDAGRAPVLSTAVGLAALALLARVRAPSSRAVLAAVAAVASWTVAGPALSDAFPALVATVAPLHAVALAPVLGAVAVAVALEEAAPLVEGALLEHDELVARVFRLGGGAFVFASLALALPSRDAFASATGEILDARASAPCGPLTPDGYEQERVHGWLAELDGGRLWYPLESLAATQCMDLDALQLASGAPLGASSTLGAHVGTLWRAFSRLEPGREGSALRAEALGVRHVLDAEGSRPPPGWRVTASSGALSIATHDQPTRLVGAGCIVARWVGSDAALRARLDAELGTPEGADRLLSPTALVALAEGPGEVVEQSVAAEGCDASTARITEVDREPGALEADVTARAPIDVVFRATAFRGWSVIVDGVPAGAIERIAPGFFAVRVPAGRHRVLARVSALPHQGWALLGAALVALFAATVRRSWFERGAPASREVTRSARRF
jgi:hypothetical protein